MELAKNRYYYIYKEDSICVFIGYDTDKESFVFREIEGHEYIEIPYSDLTKDVEPY